MYAIGITICEIYILMIIKKLVNWCTNSCIIKFITMPWSLSTSYLTIAVMRIKIIYIALKYVSLLFFVPFQATKRTQIQRKQPKVLSLKNKLENNQIYLQV